jgi:hypothetical protein
MAAFSTNEPDVRDLKLSLGLSLFDSFTRSQQAAGEISVSLANKPQRRPFIPLRKFPEMTLLFFDLPNGDYTIQVRSNANAADKKPPYYRALDLPISLPMPALLWPAFPDITLADPTKPLDDPTQSAPYRAQRKLATLQPTTAYPFPSGATLIRGTVDANGAELEGASVGRAGQPVEYVTAENGEFVLFLENANGMGESITLEASHSLFPPKQQTVKVQRGMTTTTRIILAP